MIHFNLQRLDNLVDRIENKTSLNNPSTFLREASNILHDIETVFEISDSNYTLRYLQLLQERVYQVFKREFPAPPPFSWKNACELSSCIRGNYKSDYGIKYITHSLTLMLNDTLNIEQLKYHLHDALERQTKGILNTLCKTVQEYQKNLIESSVLWVSNQENIQTTYDNQTHASTSSLEKSYSIPFNSLLDSLSMPIKLQSYTYERLFKVVQAIYAKNIPIEQLSLTRPLIITTNLKVQFVSTGLIIRESLDIDRYNQNPFYPKIEAEILKQLGAELQPNTYTDLKIAIDLIKTERAFWGILRNNRKALVGNIEIFYSSNEKTVTLLIDGKTLLDFDTLLKTQIINSRIENKDFLDIHHYVIKTKKLFTRNLYIRPSESGLPRALFITKERTYILFNRKKNQDNLIGEGTNKLITIAVDLISGTFFASATFKPISGCNVSTNELFYLNHFKNKAGFVQLIDLAKYHNKTRVFLKLYKKRSLHRVIQEKTTFQDKKNIFENLVNALAVMHQEGLLHRDLKPENVLCERNKENVIEAVISDLDTICNQNDSKELEEPCTTVWWSSPEYAKAWLKGESLIPVTTKAHDVWALGIILRQLFGLKWVLSEFDMIAFQQIATIKQREAPNQPLSPSYLIWEMTQVDPERRISAETASERLAFLDWR